MRGLVEERVHRGLDGEARRAKRAGELDRRRHSKKIKIITSSTHLPE